MDELLIRLHHLSKEGDLEACREGLKQAFRRNLPDYGRLFIYDYIKYHPNGIRLYHRKNKKKHNLFIEVGRPRNLFTLTTLPNINYRLNMGFDPYISAYNCEFSLLWTEEVLMEILVIARDLVFSERFINCEEYSKLPYTLQDPGKYKTFMMYENRKAYLYNRLNSIDSLSEESINLVYSNLLDFNQKYYETDDLRRGIIQRINDYIFCLNHLTDYKFSDSEEYDKKILELLLFPSTPSEKAIFLLDDFKKTRDYFKSFYHSTQG